MSVKSLGDLDFAGALHQDSSLGLVVVYFAELDTPSHLTVRKIIELTAQKAPFSRFYQVDFNEEEELTTKYAVSAAPTILVFRGGKVIGTSTSTSKDRLVAFFHKHEVLPESVSADDIYT